MIWRIHLIPHSRAPHNSMPYIRYYFPQAMVSSKRIKVRENPFQKLLLTLNSAWSNHSLIHGLYHLVALGGQKEIIISLNFKVEKPNDSPLPTWVAKLSIIESTFRLWDLKYTLRLVIQLSNTSYAIPVVRLASHHTQSVGNDLPKHLRHRDS